MPIIRSEESKSYTSISTYHLRDKKLSLKAKGLLTIMLSLSGGEYSLKEICKICNEEEITINTILKELEKGGYIDIRKNTESNSNNDYVYTVYEYLPFNTFNIKSNTNKR